MPPGDGPSPRPSRRYRVATRRSIIMPSRPETLPRAAGAALPRVGHGSVLGVPLALTDYAATLDWIDAAVASGHRGYICVAATHTVMACREDPELRAAVLEADLTVADGQPLVWALNLKGHRLDD